MSTELILLNDVEKLGKAGDIVHVADGFARNYLVPQGIAEPVTEAARRRLAKLQAEREKVAKALLDAAKKLAAQLKDAKITIAEKVAEGTALYGSVDAARIANALKLQGFQEVEASMIDLPENIKEIGDYDVAVKVHPDVAQVVKVWVVEDK